MYQHPTTSDHPSPVKTPITGSHVHHMCIISNFYSSYMTFTQYWYFIFPERHGSQICGLCFNPRALSHCRVPTHVWDQSWHHQVRNSILAETSSSFPSCSLPPDPSPCCGVSHQHLSPVWNVTSSLAPGFDHQLQIACWSALLCRDLLARERSQDALVSENGELKTNFKWDILTFKKTKTNLNKNLTIQQRNKALIKV